MTSQQRKVFLNETLKLNYFDNLCKKYEKNIKENNNDLAKLKGKIEQLSFSEDSFEKIKLIKKSINENKLINEKLNSKIKEINNKKNKIKFLYLEKEFNDLDIIEFKNKKNILETNIEVCNNIIDNCKLIENKNKIISDYNNFIENKNNKITKLISKKNKIKNKLVFSNSNIKLLKLLLKIYKFELSKLHELIEYNNNNYVQLQHHKLLFINALNKINNNNFLLFLKNIKLNNICECCIHNKKVIDQIENFNNTELINQIIDNINEQLINKENKIINYKNLLNNYKNIINNIKNYLLDIKIDNIKQIEHNEYLQLLDQEILVEKTKKNKELYILELNKVMKDIEDYNNYQKVLSTNQENKDKILKYNNQLNIYESQLNEITKILTKDEYELQILENNANIYNNLLNEMDKLEQKKKINYQIKKIFDTNGLPLKIIQQKLKLIELSVNEILYPFINKKVSITDDITFINVNIIDSNGVLSTFFGGMEYFICTLCFKIVLSNLLNISSTQILFIDEGVSVLDKHHIDNFNIIADFLKQYFKNIILITHITEFKNYTTNNINIKSINKYSKLIY
jgi:hypothetical protein